MSNSLSQLRQNVTDVDHQLIKLLSKRRQLVLQIGRHKLQNQLALHDPEREQELLQSLITAGAMQQLEGWYIVRLFQVILQHSLVTQLLLNNFTE